MKYKQNPFPFLEKSVFCQIFGEKISILPNFEGKKSVYTEKISMSGRSDTAYSRVLVLHMSGVRKMHVKSLSQGLNIDLA